MTVLRMLSEHELEVIGPLFEQVFGCPISRALLHWKYAQSRGESWTVWQDSKLVLHYGAMWRTVRVAGQPLRAAQLVDSMAAPKIGALRREGSAFAVLLRHLLTQRLPSPDCPQRLVYGLPSQRPCRLLELLGLGLTAGAMANLILTPAPDAGVRWSAIDPANPSWQATAQRCWEGMAADLRPQTVCERDPGYLHQRFVRHPEHRYTLLQVHSRWLRRPHGLAVLRASGHSAELLDLVAPLNQQAAVLAGVRAWMAHSGITSASFLASPPVAAHLGALVDRNEATEFRIMTNPFSPPALLDQVREGWWFTGGDTEYR